MRALFKCLIFTSLVFASKSFAGVISTPLSFNDFFVDVPSSTTISADGSSATLTEDDKLAAVSLFNDPYFGDPEIIVAAENTSLVLNYDFYHALDNTDHTSIRLIDSDSGSSLFLEIVETTSVGEISFDLSGFVGTTLGLELVLRSDNGDQGVSSHVTFSNLRLEQTIADVTESGSMALMTLALGFLVTRRRRVR